MSIDPGGNVTEIPFNNYNDDPVDNEYVERSHNRSKPASGI